MDNGTKEALTIMRMSQGGYLVTEAYQPDRFQSHLFAATTIDEALAFMKAKVLPITPEQKQAFNMIDAMKPAR